MLPRYIAALSMDFVVKHEILGKSIYFAKRQFSSLADLDGVRMVLACFCYKWECLHEAEKNEFAA